jgi:hypothetical protein
MDIVIMKNIFLEGEEIGLGVRLKNITNSSQLLKSGALDIKIFDADNNPLRSSGLISISDLTHEKKMILNNSDLYQVFNITEVYGNKSFNKTAIPYLKEGKYLIEVRLTYPNGFVEVKAIRILVVKPKEEELTFFDGFNRVLSSKGTKEYNTEYLIKQLEELHVKYPNSVYTPSLLDELYSLTLIWHKSPNYTKAMEYLKDWLTNYSWSVRGLGNIKILFQNEKISKQERLSLLQKMMIKAEKSPMERVIKEYIKKETGR